MSDKPHKKEKRNPQHAVWGMRFSLHALESGLYLDKRYAIERTRRTKHGPIHDAGSALAEKRLRAALESLFADPVRAAQTSDLMLDTHQHKAQASTKPGQSFCPSVFITLEIPSDDPAGPEVEELRTEVGWLLDKSVQGNGTFQSGTHHRGDNRLKLRSTPHHSAVQEDLLPLWLRTASPLTAPGKPGDAGGMPDIEINKTSEEEFSRLTGPRGEEWLEARCVAMAADAEELQAFQIRAAAKVQAHLTELAGKRSTTAAGNRRILNGLQGLLAANKGIDLTMQGRRINLFWYEGRGFVAKTSDRAGNTLYQGEPFPTITATTSADRKK